MTLTVPLINDLARKGNKFKVAGNQEYEDTDHIYSEVSSFVDYPVFVILVT